MSAITSTTVQRIQTLADELFNMGNTALEKVNEAGRLLTECKEGLAHGQWTTWLEENFTFTDRTARRWMKLHEDIVAGRLKSDTVSGLAEAYKLTTEPRWGATDKAPAPPSSPAPRPSPAPVTIEAEIVEPPANRLPTDKQPAAWERAQEIAADEDRRPLDDQKTAAILEPQEFYGLILSMLPHLTKSEIKSLIETLNTRWT